MKLIVVGKLKNSNLQAIEEDYLKRIKQPPIEITEVKASSENKRQEAQSVLKLLAPQDYLVLLTEHGKVFDSQQFSSWMQAHLSKKLVFVICGAEGPDQSLLDRAQLQLSLSPLTMPHKLARIILIEQLYRAQTIRDGHPYHN